jgi:hypothetical protein
MITIINKKANREIAQSKMEDYLKYCELVRWGRRNPSKFAEFMYGIQFMDYQKYCFDDPLIKDMYYGYVVEMLVNLP